MLDKNQVMKDSVRYFAELVMINDGEVKQGYKDSLKELINTIASKDFKLMDECQQIIRDTVKEYEKQGFSVIDEKRY